MNFSKNCFILILLLVVLLGMGSICAADMEDVNATESSFDASIDEAADYQLQSSDDSIYAESSEEIVIENWEELQLYSSLNDKNYVLRLKENTNYYPNDPTDSSYQVIFNNNVTLIGAEGAYIGDTSPVAGNITYTAMKVPDNNGVGITLKNLTFKWIGTRYQPDGVFLQMGGNSINYIENCYFTNISTNLGHSSILYIKTGDAVVTNCTFINCTTDFGCLSVYNPNDDPTKICLSARMNLSDSYFEGNYARTEPGCINNCGVLIATNCTFYRNSAFWWAGAIHTHGGANTTLYDCTFTDNVAGWNGGALYTYSYLQIYNCTFTGNNCTTNNGGGAIGACKYLHAPYIYVVDSLFENNENTCWALDELSTSGTGRGGAISLMDEGGLQVYNSTFIKNSASIGTAICAINGGLSYGSPDVVIAGNQFINHTRIGDVLDVRVATGSIADIHDNYYLNNSLVFTKLKLEAEDPDSYGRVTFHLDAVLKNPTSFDSDILDKSLYDVYVNDVYSTTVSSRDFTLNLGNGNIVRVYVVPSISNSKSNEVLAGKVKEYIYVSQSGGNDNNNGLSRSQPVKTLNKSIELARATENIIIMDGTFTETDLIIDYNLTVTAENGASIMVTGNAFTITDGDVQLIDLTFKNSKYGSSTKTRLISQTSTGFLILNGCIFENNEYKAHIEADGMVEAENLKFTNNKDGALFRANSITIKSSEFTDNIVTYSLYKSILMYKTQTTKFVAENLTFTGNTVYSGCIGVKKNKATVTDCTFIGNKQVSGRASGIYMEDSNSLVVESCKFINNTDTGKYASVIYIGSGSLAIRDSILINNSYENDNHIVINGGETHLRKLVANNNWWGNTPEDLSKPALKVFPVSNQLPNGWDPAKTWLVLNASSLSSEVELNQMVPVQFSFTQIDNEGNITAYDGVKLPSFELELTATNGTCPDNKITVENGMGVTYFTLTQMSTASLTGTFNGISVTYNFQFTKTVPNMTITANDINVGDNANIVVNLPSGATGSVSIDVDGITMTKTVSNSQATFSVPNLPAGNHTIEATYSGNDRYASANATSSLTVFKHNSTTELSVGAIEVNTDVVFTITVSDGATGTVDVYVNGAKETINVGQTYTISNIPRGDYVVRAVYSGDSYYLPSEDEFIFDVGKLNPTMTVSIPDVTYGSDTVATVNLNNDATGQVTVTIDGKSATGTLSNGKATVTISEISAGNKNANIFYSGDNKYKNATTTKAYKVNKASLDFTIVSNNIKLGQNAVVTIQLPARSGGTLTISGIRSEIKSVPLTGLLTLTYSDLAVGTYTVSAEYNGDNYLTTSKSTTFSVSDWDTPQWPNDGYDVKNTENTPYSSEANGNVKWIKDINGSIIGSMVIDGIGNVYITTSNGIYSINPNGETNWIFNSQDAGEDFSGIAISRDVILAPKTGDKLYFINQTTGERYNNNIYQGSSDFAPIVDGDANIYTAGEYYGYEDTRIVIIPYKIWQTSTAPTEIDIGDYEITSSPVLVSDDIIAFTTTTSLMGVEISSESIIFNIPVISDVRPAVGANNIIYIISNGHVMGYNVGGSKVSDVAITGTPGDYLAIGNQGEIYSVNKQGKLFDYSNGVETLIYDFNEAVSARLLIDNDDNIYVGSESGMMYAIDIDGNLLWSVNLNESISGSIVMDADGTIFTLSGNRIIAIGDAQLKDPNMEVTINNVTYGNDVTVDITMNSEATGTVSIKIGTKYDEEFNIENGQLSVDIPNLTSGTYTAVINYNGDNRFESKRVNVRFNVAKAEPTMNCNNTNIMVGETLVVNVFDLPNDATGTVSISVNGLTGTANVVNGAATLRINGLAKGEYTYTVTYSGNTNYLSKSISKPVSVGYVQTSFNANVQTNPINVGDTARIIVSGLPSDASGTVYIELNGIRYSQSVSNGAATITISNLGEGDYSDYVIYTNDPKYSADSKPVSFRVNKITPTFTVSLTNNIYVGDDVVVDVTGLPSDATGLIIVSGDVSANNTVSNGNSHLVIPQDLANGTYSINVTYEGDYKYNSISTTKTLKINKANPTLAVDIDDINVEDPLIIGLTLPDDATGQINASIEGISAVSAVNDGMANIAILQELTEGYYPVNIVYSGDRKYNSITQTVYVNITKKHIEMVVSSPNKINYGNDLVIRVSNLPTDKSQSISITGDFNAQGTIGSNGVAEITVPNLTAGTYSFTVNYPTSEKYDIPKVVKTVTVNKLHISFDCAYENITYGQIAEFYISGLPSDATGTITIANTYEADVNEGSAEISIPNLAANAYTYRVKYSGDNNYYESSMNIKFNVAKANPVIDVVCGDITYGERLPVDVVMNGSATGKLNFTIDGKSKSMSINNGVVSTTIAGVTAGSKTLVVSYAGDDNYNSASVSKSVVVGKANPSISVTANAITYGDDMVIQVTMNSTATGSVSAVVDGKTVSANLNNGKATLTVSGVTAGNKAVKVNYAGDSNYKAVSATKSVVVSKANPSIVVNADVITYGERLPVDVTINASATGKLNFTVDGKAKSMSIKNGAVSTTISGVTAGTKTLVVTYSGDDNYNSASVSKSVVVNKATPSIVVNADVITYGERLPVDVTINASATGKLNFTVDGKSKSMNIKNGAVSTTIAGVTAGTKTLVVTYSGDDNYNGASVSKSVVVNKATPSISVTANAITYGDDLVVKVTANSTATGSVTVNVDGKSVSANLTNGKATLTVSGVTGGSKTVKVTYAGDSNYKNASASKVVTVNKANPTFIVSADEITFGEILIVKAVLNDDATGRVFTNINGRINRATISDGVANVIISGLTAGQKHIVVNYTGDKNYNYVEDEIDVTVNKQTPTWNITYNNVKNVGDDLTITISGLPTNGAKYVYVTGEVYQRLDLVNGSAVSVIPNLSQGTHEFTILYKGNLNYNNISRDISVDVGKIDIDYTLDVDEINYYRQDVEINMSGLPNDASGIFKVIINDNEYESSVENGNAQISIPDLSIGSYTAFVSYYNDSKYMADMKNVSFEVVRINPDIDVSVNPIYYGDDLIVDVTAPSDITNTATVTVNGESKIISFNNGVGQASFSGLSAGQYDVTVSYEGDSVYSNASFSASANVMKAVPDFVLSVDSIYLGDDLVVNVTSVGDLAYRVNVTVGDKSKLLRLNNGAGTVRFSGLALGTYEVTAVYKGDYNYLPVSDSATVEVMKVIPDFAISADEINYGGDLVVNVTSVADLAYRVNVTVGDQSKLLRLKDGKGSVKFTDLAVGTYTVTAVYKGDSVYAAVSDSVSVIVMNPIPKNFKVYAENTYGNALVVNVTCDDELAYRVNVTVGDQSKLLRLKDGKGSLKFTGLEFGTYTVTATYKGDSVYSAVSDSVSVVVMKPVPKNFAVSADAVYYGNDLVVTVTSDDDLAYRVNVTVGDQSKLLRLKDGTGSVKFSGLAVGTYEVIAIYKGDNDYSPVSVNTSVEVMKPVPENFAVSADAVYCGDDLVVTVTSGDELAYRVNVTVAGQSQLVRLKNGVGTVRFSGLGIGTYTVTALYKGDDNYSPISVDTSVEVMKPMPKDFSVSANDINSGEDLVVTVNSGDELAYRVNVTVGDQSKLVRLNNGKGTVKFSGLQTGQYTVVALYKGDENYSLVSASASVQVR